MTIQYKYNEGDLLQQVTDYVNATYAQHYSQNKYQATEFIIDGGHGVGFSVGNILKYAQRYGRKGTPEDWRKDLMKVIHYAIIALHVHDKEQQITISDSYGDVNTEPYTLTTSLSTVDTITFPNYHEASLAVPNFNDYTMETSSLLTTDEIPSINITGTKTKKKKG